MQSAMDHAMHKLQGDLPMIVRKIASDYAPQQPDETVPNWMRRAGKEITAKHGKDVVVVMDWGTKHTIVTSVPIINLSVDRYLKACKNIPVETHPIRIGTGNGKAVDFPYGALIKVLLDAEHSVEDAAPQHKDHNVLRVLTVCADRMSYTARTAWL